MDKWDSIKKKPAKLCDMLTGYHTSQALIKLAFDSAGITDTRLLAIQKMEKSYGERLVHKLVAEFLQLRFPILLALNKVDLTAAVGNLEKFKVQYSNMTMVPVSARTECFLQRKCKDGVVGYQSGASCFDFNSQSQEQSESSKKELEQIQENILQVFGDTGILRALSQAVSLRSPTYAFPVSCLDSYHSISVKTNEKPQILRDCIMLKPGTTVGKLFNIMLYPPVSLLAGEYVRAEGVDSNGVKKVLHKTDLINESNQIIKIMSTKKASSSAKTRN